MKDRPTMHKIVLNDAHAIKAAQTAVWRSRKDGKAARMVKDAMAKPPVVKDRAKH